MPQVDRLVSSRASGIPGCRRNSWLLAEFMTADGIPAADGIPGYRRNSWISDGFHAGIRGGIRSTGFEPVVNYASTTTF